MLANLLLILLIIENIGFFYFMHLARQDRNELIKRCSPGYMASSDKNVEKRPPPGNRKNMLQEQQRKMLKTRVKGDDA